jgi:succinate-semialdehyde dehydrogenase/glutarate-semialdehyde dehydrogenase
VSWCKYCDGSWKTFKKGSIRAGGNDVFIILEDADMEKTVEWAVVGRMNNNDQCCVASKGSLQWKQ